MLHGAVNMVLSQKESRIRKQLLETETHKAKEAKRMQQVDFSSNSKNENGTNSNADDNLGPPSRSKCFQLVFSPGLTAALDRTKVSDRNVVEIISAAAESFGHSSSALA